MAEDPTQACTLALDMDDVPSSKADGWATLKSLNPTYQDYTLEVNEVTIGRHPNSTIHFNDLNISAKHCEIKRESDSPIIAFLYDHSTNGTYVDGLKVGKGSRCLLSSGQEISLVQTKKQGQEKIAFIYQACEKEEDEDGGPQKKYHIGETLGTGNFATVKLAVDKKTGSKFAIKIIDKKKYSMNASSRKDSLMDEVNILKSLNHENIIHIEEVFNTEKTLYLVLELVEGGELLNDILSNQNACYGEPKAKTLFYQLVNAVKYLHDQGIAHRDLKPENILLKHKKVDLTDKGTIKLSDFGLSRTITDGSFMKTMCGTPQYLAPEILTNGSNGIGGYGKEVDCWSLGGILYVMLCGYPPFSDSKEMSIFESIRNSTFEFSDEDWGSVSADAKDLIKRLLTVNPSKRYTCDSILNHPWYNNNITLKSLLEKDEITETKVLGKRKSEENLTSKDESGNDSNGEDTGPLSILDNNNGTVLKKSRSNLTGSISHSDTSVDTIVQDDDSDTDDEETQVFDLKPISPIRQKSNSNLTPSASSTPSLSSTNNNGDTGNSSNSNNVVFLVPAPKQTPSPQSSSPPLTSTSPQQSSPPKQSSSPPPTNNGNNSNNNSNKPMCMYGEKCYRKNENHFKEYRHPHK